MVRPPAPGPVRAGAARRQARGRSGRRAEPRRAHRPSSSGAALRPDRTHLLGDASAPTRGSSARSTTALGDARHGRQRRRRRGRLRAHRSRGRGGRALGGDDRPAPARAAPGWCEAIAERLPFADGDVRGLDGGALRSPLERPPAGACGSCDGWPGRRVVLFNADPGENARVLDDDRVPAGLRRADRAPLPRRRCVGVASCARFSAPSSCARSRSPTTAPTASTARTGDGPRRFWTRQCAAASRCSPSSRTGQVDARAWTRSPTTCAPGAWRERHRELLELDELHLGYYVVVAELSG